MQILWQDVSTYEPHNLILTTTTPHIKQEIPKYNPYAYRLYFHFKHWIATPKKIKHMYNHYCRTMFFTLIVSWLKWLHSLNFYFKWLIVSFMTNIKINNFLWLKHLILYCQIRQYAYTCGNFGTHVELSMVINMTNLTKTSH